VVQEAFIRVHRTIGGGAVRSPLAYLRQTVINLARSEVRRRLIRLRHAPRPMPDAASAEEGAYAAISRQEVIRAPGPNTMVPFYHWGYHAGMALNIKDPETERLAAEVAALMGETKTGAIRYALRQVLQAQSAPSARQREERLTRFLEEEIWPLIPPDQLGKPVSKAEREEILGFGQDGA
jgi:antitoxin VapB